MKPIRNFLTAAVVMMAVFICGCAGAQAPSAVAAPIATVSSGPVVLGDIDAKLDNAIAIAKAGGDEAGAACFTAARGWVDTLPLPQAAPALPEPIGLSGAFETARIKVNALNAKATALKMALAGGAPPTVTNSCAVLVVDAQAVAVKILGLVGLGAAAGALPVLAPVALVPAPLP